MVSPFVSVCASLLLSVSAGETKFIQLHPVAGTGFQRSPGTSTAVVLMQGLRPHPFSDLRVHVPIFYDWQHPKSVLVKLLAKQADVYAFAYGQDVPVEEIAAAPGLYDNIQRLRQLGYRDLVLIGHSAGGLIARQFVEDYPGGGVTKVIQVCTPNDGSDLGGKAKVALRKSQGPFLASLTPEHRRQLLQTRPDKKIPAHVEFVCVVGTAFVLGDGIVRCGSQWPPDLQEQGIPAVPLFTNHELVMRLPHPAQRIAELVPQEQPRWTAAAAAAMRRKLFLAVPLLPAARVF
jgi:hypothetical protein